MTKAYNVNCMDVMAVMQDNEFDLAIVDPPYGIGIAKDGFTTIGEGPRGKAKRKNYGAVDWDAAVPSADYFEELRRVSKNQIIWGGNYFLDHLPSTPCLIVWDKDNGTFSMADCEVAWASFPTAIRKFKYKWSGMLQQNMKNKELRIHPTQKPIDLYKWLLSKYAKPGDTILDTHLGSGSSRIAAHEMGFDFVGYEISQSHFEDQEARFANHIRQGKLFKADEMYLL